MTDLGMLTPGAHRVAGLADDEALVAALVRVETAWFRVLAGQGAATPDQLAAVESAAATWRPDLSGLAAEGEDGGNPVLPVLRGLRAHVAERDDSAAALLHRGLTSQDVLDTALMLLAAGTVRRVSAHLDAVGCALGRHAEEHRASVMAGRTLTQHAVPVTFGLKAAQWLAGTLDALDQLERLQLPAQCGGAAGTRALAGQLLPDPAGAAESFAVLLGLAFDPMPWHTRRTPVTRLGDALVGVCDALGVIGSDVALLSRPEIAELSEGAPEGRGGSSTMPHKRNPVLGVLLRAAAQQAPLLGAQLHLAAGSVVDERPDGAWHAEWPALRRLMVVTATAAAQAADLVPHLEVHADTMRDRAVGAAEVLLAERGTGGADPASYLGANDALVDHALTRLRAREPRHG
ncbi:MAG: lyase family protein [Marmoricola sp.]